VKYFQNFIILLWVCLPLSVGACSQSKSPRGKNHSGSGKRSGEMEQGKIYETKRLRVSLVASHGDAVDLLVEKRFQILDAVLRQYYTVRRGDSLGGEEIVETRHGDQLTLDFNTGLTVRDVGVDLISIQVQHKEFVRHEPSGIEVPRIYYEEEKRPQPFVILENAATGKTFKLLGKLN